MMNNPYLGLRSYEESDAAIFKGRTAATSDLYDLLIHNEYVVFHSESGEGKSSLINAGLCPILREERYFPIRISFTENNFNDSKPDFDEILRSSITDAICQANDTELTDMESLISHAGPNMSKNIRITPCEQSAYLLDMQDKLQLYRNSWWLLRNYMFEAFGVKFTPVIIFDQFEEVFTRPHDITWTEDFFIWLKTLSTDAVPDSIIHEIREYIGEQASFPKLNTCKHFKALFSLRNEYIGDLDYWGVQRHFIAPLKNSRYCLKPLTLTETDEVLSLHDGFSDGIKAKIKASLSAINITTAHERYSNLPSVSALLLSVVCDSLSSNESHVSSNEILQLSGEKGLTEVIGQFYDRTIQQSGIPPQVQQVLENVLVDQKGKRVRIKSDWESLAAISFEEKYMTRLIDSRLIKCSKINGDSYIELTHDILARLIDERRRLQAEAKQQKQGSWTNRIIAIQTAMAALFGASLVFDNYLSGNNLFFRQFGHLPWFAIICLLGLILSFIYRKPKSKIRNTLYIITALLFTYAIDRMPRADHDIGLAIFLCKQLILYGSLLAILLIPLHKTRLRYIFKCIVACLIIISLLKFSKISGFLLFTYAYLIFAPYSSHTRHRGLLVVTLLAVLASVSLLISIYNPLDEAIFDNAWAILICTSFFLWTVPLKLNVYNESNLSDAIRYCLSWHILYDEPRLLRSVCVFALTLILSATAILGLSLSDKYEFFVIPLLCMAAYICIFILLSGIKGLTSIRKKPTVNRTRLTISMLTVGIISAGINTMQYVNYGAFGALVLIGLGCLILYKLRPDNVTSSRNWKWQSSALCLCTLLVMPLTGIGYNIFAYPQYARTSDQCLRPSEPVKYKYIVVKDTDGKVGVRDRFHMVIPTEYEAISPQITFTCGDLARWNMPKEYPDIVFNVKKDNTWSQWHCVTHLDMNNSCTDAIVKQLEDNLRYTPLTDNAITYLNYLKATGTDDMAIQDLAENYISKILLDRVNADMQNRNRLYITSLDKVVTMAGELDYATVSGNYERIFPYADPTFSKWIIEDIQCKTKDWVKAHSAEERNNILSYKYLLANDFNQAAAKARSALASDSTLLKSTASRIMANYLSGETDKAESLLKNNANRMMLSQTYGQAHEPDDSIWYCERYNTVANELRQYIKTFRLIGLITETQAQHLQQMIDSCDAWSGYKPFDLIQKVNGNDSTLRLINTSDPEPYSYFVDHGKVVSPYIALFAMPVDPYSYYETPVLVVDRFTGKRSYITSPKSETISDFNIPKIIPGEYNHAWRFSEGLAAVEVNGKIGFIDTDGNMVIEPQFSSRMLTKGKNVYHPSINLYTGPKNVDIIFREGLCPVANDEGKYGLIDHSGKWVTEPIYDYIGPYDSPQYDSGFRKVRINPGPSNDGMVEYDFRYGLLDNKGRELLPPEYPSDIYVNEGTVYVPEWTINKANDDLETYHKQVEWEDSVQYLWN